MYRSYTFFADHERTSEFSQAHHLNRIRQILVQPADLARHAEIDSSVTNVHNEPTENLWVDLHCRRLLVSS